MASLQDLLGRDLAFAYSDAGVPVVYGAYTTKGVLLDEALDVLQMSSKVFAVQDTTKTLTIVTGTIGTIKNNTGITVNGTDYKINKFIPLGSGKETKLWLVGE